MSLADQKYSLVYLTGQRFPATATSSCVSGNVSSCEPEVLQSSMSVGGTEDHFSNPSLVVDQPLHCPTEQSSSSSDDEGSTTQSRKVSPLMHSSGNFGSTVIPHLKGSESTTYDPIEEDVQKTWGPSDNPYAAMPKPRRRSSSCPTSPTSTTPGVAASFHPRQARQNWGHADEVQIGEGSLFAHKPELYDLKEHQLGSKTHTGGRDSKLGQDREESDFEEAKPDSDQERCDIKPIQCTNCPPINDIFTDSKRKSTVQNFKFRDLESYGDSFGYNSSFINIYSTLEAVREINFRAMQPLKSGGNSTVYSYDEIAIKETLYDQKALNVICELQHSNVMELLGVALLDRYSEVCYHIMPLMTYDLHRALRSASGTVCKLARNSNGDTWVTVKSNVVYILKEVLGGLSYLHEHYIQHGDIKANNILIKKTCQCRDVLLCMCPYDKKYLVKLADFDYIRQLETYHNPANFLSSMNYTWYKYGGGTVPFRGPEESIKDDTGKSLNGPSSDVYSFGVMLLMLCLGGVTRREKREANIRAREPDVSELTERSEAPFVQQKHVEFLNAARRCCRLHFLVDIVYDCLTLNPSDRPTAYELLCGLQHDN